MILSRVWVALALATQAYLVGMGRGFSAGIAGVTWAVASLGLLLSLPGLQRRWVTVVALLGWGGWLLWRWTLGFGDEIPPAGFRILPHRVLIVAAEALLILQAGVLWRWRKREPLPRLWAGLSLLTTAVALDRAYDFQDQSVFVLLTVLALLFPALAIGCSRPGPARREGAEIPGARRLLVACAGVVLVGTWLVADVWSTSLPELQSWFVQAVGQRTGGVPALRHYVNSGSLSAIRTEISAEPSRTALRVYSDRRPGYLAARKFDFYQNGSWRLASDSQRRNRAERNRGLTDLEPGRSVAGLVSKVSSDLPYFILAAFDSSESQDEMTIENDPRRGAVYFLPNRGRVVQIWSDGLKLDEFGMIRAGANPSQPYTVWAAVDGTDPPPQGRVRQQLLEPVAELPEEIDRLARQVVRDALTTRDKIEAIESFFQEQFAYSLEPTPYPPDSDPLAHFLVSRHPAHCEYFASAAVALLRLNEIPARYCVGFRVTTLEEENEDYWLARNRNAHAWAEAYDAQRQRWVIVEATPGFERLADEEADRLATRRGATQDIGQLGDRAVKGLVEQFDLLMKSNWFRGALLGAALLGFGVVLLRLWREDRDGEGRQRPELHALRRELRRLESRLRRRRWIRRTDETVLQFASRIEQDSSEPWGPDVVTWLRRYSHERYRDETPKPRQTRSPAPRLRRSRKA